jgi:hypothetical protein
VDKNWNVSHQRIFLFYLPISSSYFPYAFFLEERGFISWFTTPEEQTHVRIYSLVAKGAQGINPLRSVV